ncbi:MAG: iron-sulfur cluster carrier protein ApbC [Pseudomonadota bacterium]
MPITEKDIKRALEKVNAPLMQQNIVATKQLKKIAITNDVIKLNLALGYPAKDYLQEFETEIRQNLAALAVKKIDVAIEWGITPHHVQGGMRGLDNVKNIIAVASGKGGVGKSTVTANIALALAQQGANVGVLDADIYGPNQPLMLGAKGEPEQIEKKIKPLISHGIQSMSIGYLIAQDDTPMIWRGPMISTALQQLLRDTLWENLDYLLIDLPPGTGDIQLTLSQKIPVSGAVIVTTPQDIALMDARKAFKMFDKVNIPTLGIIENMSTYICPNCSYEDNIFGSGGAEQMAQQYSLNLLGQIPLAKSIRENADSGNPSVIAEVDSEISKRYIEIAIKTAIELALQAPDQSKRFPKIVIE